MTTLRGQKIIITGAARGLGLAFAEAACAAGADIVIADLLAKQGEQSAQALRGEGYNSWFVPLDLADVGTINRCADQAATLLGGITGLVNNAAIATNIGGKTFEEIEIEHWDRVMNVNVRGTWLMTRAAAPYLRKNNAASVVNIASDTALWGAPRLLHYVSSKGAVIAMSRALARELGPDNIAVNVIAPGLTLTEATEYVPAERHQLYIDGRAIPRAQLPQDIAAAVIFFLSAAAGFITGQVLPVNGGFVMN